MPRSQDPAISSLIHILQVLEDAHRDDLLKQAEEALKGLQ
jgi:hypothetical protein